MYAWFVFDMQPINAPIQGGLQAAQERGRILATPGIGGHRSPDLSAAII